MLIVSEVKPKFTVADVKDIKDVLASFTTNFNKFNSSRTHNIKLACNKINNFLLKPGEQFSMNAALGPRTVKNGYMQAPIIINNELIPGTGGGVCQVTSTLYNAVLFSGLQVVQRRNHSITLGYIPPGQDATIAEGYIDFKFKNNRDYTICISAEVKDNLLNIKIIGRKNSQEPTIILKPVIIEEFEPDDPEYTIDNSLADNMKKIIIKEKKGMRIALYRQSLDGQGKLIKNEKISEDIYKPIKGEIAVNKNTYDRLNIN
jgi:vancomycin resistance protein YoaR